MKSSVIFAFGLVMLLTLVESVPIDTIEERAEDLQMAENIEDECK